MAWHMGFPLSQCLFTSHYIDRLLWPEPKSLDEARFDRGKKPAKGNKLLHIVLRAYCLSLIKTCDFVHRRLSTEKLFEVCNIETVESIAISLLTRRRKRTLSRICFIETYLGGLTLRQYRTSCTELLNSSRMTSRQSTTG